MLDYDLISKIRARQCTRNEAAVTASSIDATESLHSDVRVVLRKVLHMHRLPPVIRAVSPAYYPTLLLRVVTTIIGEVRPKLNHNPLASI